ncbi:Fe-S cluster assembly sulfur transfer protein SufU [Falseniella ignava]|uniref:NifU family SUF system FeS assembly protein n=1 Tax=Falseniella ignava CCUG 37419 TaxID=883112 RepID=K1MQH7_9LACT|nr:SUF system NifU family Fe-S cluster assembly protein [Falseniella ignava]EKB58344.1 NifU family SUF system FeS assembly protein [Falseniella ignava CCUG 37419]
MSLNKLNRMDQLYKAVIVERSTHPKHRGQLAEATHEFTLLNPSCGDTVYVQIQVVDQRVEAVCFNGEGCAISMASADIMAEVLQGKTLEEAEQLIEDFNALVQGQPVAHLNQLGEAQAIEGVRQFPARIRCAQLAWKAFQQAVDEDEVE